jgi:hypothetical protein
MKIDEPKTPFNKGYSYVEEEGMKFIPEFNLIAQIEVTLSLS